MFCQILPDQFRIWFPIELAGLVCFLKNSARDLSFYLFKILFYLFYGTWAFIFINWLVLFNFPCIGHPSPNGDPGYQSTYPPNYRTCFEFVRLVSKVWSSVLGIPPYTVPPFYFFGLYVCMSIEKLFSIPWIEWHVIS